MAANKKVLSLPGDGIGPEVMRQVGRIIEWFDRRRIATFDVTEGLVGGAALDAHGVPLTDETRCRSNRSPSAVCCGCARRWTCSRTCGPRWSSIR
jgi:3-isopropylmalate dehydrogenase